MIIKKKFFHLWFLYIFFIFLSLIIFFFSTTNLKAKAFDIDNIEISRPFEINFNKNEVLDEGFQKAFSKLIFLIVNSKDRKKISQTKLNEIKGMIESFSIQQEEFINEVYFVNLGVSFNKKKVFNFLEKKNIFPTLPLSKKLLFIPIIIDENKKDLLIFSNNKIFKEWNNLTQNYHLIEYILPTEDLEDLNFIKKNYDIIEQYDFKEIINKYNLNDSIIALMFKNGNEMRILSRISVNDDTVLKNLSFSKIDINNTQDIENIINNLKIIYEDHWKGINQINTSIKLPLKIRMKSFDSNKILHFENILQTTDLIYDFFIIKFDQDFIYYQIIFNGTPNNFIKSMKKKDFEFDTQNKVWTLK
tara:strand:- start:1402 stop:2481 length:1080 start_codon:yes stop_codon:yes gene_type:complete